MLWNAGRDKAGRPMNIPADEAVVAAISMTQPPGPPSYGINFVHA